MSRLAAAYPDSWRGVYANLAAFGMFPTGPTAEPDPCDCDFPDVAHTLTCSLRNE